MKGSVLKGTLLVSVLMMLASLIFFLIGEREGVAVFSGVMLSAIFVTSSAWVLDAFKNAENQLFIQVFIFSIAVRFLLILLLFGVMVQNTLDLLS